MQSLNHQCENEVSKYAEIQSHLRLFSTPYMKFASVQSPEFHHLIRRAINMSDSFSSRVWGASETYHIHTPSKYMVASSSKLQEGPGRQSRDGISNPRNVQDFLESPNFSRFLLSFPRQS